MHEHLKLVDEISRQELIATADALKNLKKALRRDMEDQATYQQQCHKSVDDSMEQVTNQINELARSVQATQTRQVEESGTTRRSCLT